MTRGRAGATSPALFILFLVREAKTVTAIETCPHCGRVNELATSIGENLEISKRVPKAGDFGICIGCGEWHIFEADGGRRKPNDDEYETIATSDTFRKIRKAWVAATQAIESKGKPKPEAKPMPGTQGRALAKGHFHKEFERLKHMGGGDGMPPSMRAALMGVYAVAVLDIFEQIDRAKSLGLTEGVAFLTALKNEAQEFANEAGREAIKQGSVKQ